MIFYDNIEKLDLTDFPYISSVTGSKEGRKLHNSNNGYIWISDEEYSTLCCVVFYFDYCDICWFEVSVKLRHLGLGEVFYKELEKFCRCYTNVIYLDPLDDLALAFWTHQGFVKSNSSLFTLEKRLEDFDYTRKDYLIDKVKEAKEPGAILDTCYGPEEGMSYLYNCSNYFLGLSRFERFKLNRELKKKFNRKLVLKKDGNVYYLIAK